MGKGDGDVGEDDGGVGEDRGDDDGPRQQRQKKVLITRKYTG